MALKEEQKKLSSDPNENRKSERKGKDENTCSSGMAAEKKIMQKNESRQVTQEQEEYVDDAEECCGEV